MKKCFHLVKDEDGKYVCFFTECPCDTSPESCTFADPYIEERRLNYRPGQEKQEDLQRKG